MERLLARLSTTRLKDLIREVRSCKTIAEERDVITRESASMRTCFKDDDAYLRSINVSKLLYIHMLGYPTHFGQIECLKLAASQKLMKKRLGYLGVSLLINNKEVLILITNSIKQDLQSTNKYVCGMALSVLSDIVTTDMANELYTEVEKILDTSDVFLRSKATICSLRIIKRCPHLAEKFVSKAKSLLYETSNSALITGITLLIELCQRDPKICSSIRMVVTKELVNHLTHLAFSSSSREYSVDGVSDPFLQVKILQLLRIMGKGSQEASEQMSDVLSQIATNADSKKNAVYSILYETVLTIIEIESSKAMKLLSINILGGFLANQDNNIRYVALATLSKIFSSNKSKNITTLKHHKYTIMTCLKDPDSAIRTRALDIIFAVANTQNVRFIVKEVIVLFETYPMDIKASVVSRLCDVLNTYEKNKKVLAKHTCDIIRSAGPKSERDIIESFVQIFDNNDSDVEAFATKMLYSVIKETAPVSYKNTVLVQAVAWCIGEYGDLIVNQTNVDNKDPAHFEEKITEPLILDLLQDIIRYTGKNPETVIYVLTSLAKLSVRFTDAASLDSIKRNIDRFRSNADINVQQRACIYYNILKLDISNRRRLLASIPAAVDVSEKNELCDKTVAEGSKGLKYKGNPLTSSSIVSLDKFHVENKYENEKKVDGAALLKEIFSEPNTPNEDATKKSYSYTIFEKGGIIMKITVTRSEDKDKVKMETVITNTTDFLISDIQLQMAVPKIIMLEVYPLNSHVINPHSSISQHTIIHNKKHSVIKLRFKIEYKMNNDLSIKEMFEFSDLDPALWT